MSKRRERTFSQQITAEYPVEMLRKSLNPEEMAMSINRSAVSSSTLVAVEAGSFPWSAAVLVLAAGSALLWALYLIL
jgi:hypothetical protein